MNESDVRISGRDRILGVLGVLFFGIWTVFFGIGAVLMIAILAGGADNPVETILLAIVCAAISVFNSRRLRGPLRRLRRTQQEPAPTEPR
ncbi:hypothetical protein [Actinoplanes sp. L3-i22]|uniref:hypothetical protein n=1 Tax=Actinoplanes sp. L3-i22 TaxID=2836373 RepID=UPI001C75CBD3|nr:hypothetical protein [Actinoplanes sp. L3-i22]BCY09536.1 hypothetical protein L3i22_046240 [Actinoplanes sp. L3-i22]